MRVAEHIPTIAGSLLAGGGIYFRRRSRRSYWLYLLVWTGMLTLALAAWFVVTPQS